jgi:lactate dehydrogenase-like 2-hydroxyacid dehydrogenase
VFEHEPQVPAALRSFDNVVLMPHRGGGTFETWHDLGELMRANLRAFFQGEPLVTPIP